MRASNSFVKHSHQMPLCFRIFPLIFAVTIMAAETKSPSGFGISFWEFDHPSPVLMYRLASQSLPPGLRYGLFFIYLKILPWLVSEFHCPALLNVNRDSSSLFLYRYQRRFEKSIYFMVFWPAQSNLHIFDETFFRLFWYCRLDFFFWFCDLADCVWWLQWFCHNT